MANVETDVSNEREFFLYWLLQAYNTIHRHEYEDGMTDAELSDALLNVLANLDYDPNLSAKAQELLKRPPAFHPEQTAQRWNLAAAVRAIADEHKEAFAEMKHAGD
jgi:hypothetical protein